MIPYWFEKWCSATHAVSYPSRSAASISAVTRACTSRCGYGSLAWFGCDVTKMPNSMPTAERNSTPVSPPSPQLAAGLPQMVEDDAGRLVREFAARAEKLEFAGLWTMEGLFSE